MGTLHLVATPIGNLEDVTLRALRVLREADVLYAEDTRRTRVLLDRHAIAARPRSLHEHNEVARIAEVLAHLGAGAQVALVSDAGMPLVSDPGAKLVAAAIAAGHAVVPIPGASAPIAALAASGLGGGPFHFVGFLPRKAGERTRLLAGLRDRSEALVLFEAPARVGATLEALAEAFGAQRAACVARELTKVHEEFARGTLAELAAHFAEGARGEVTIVVQGAGEEARAPAEAPEATIAARIDALAADGLRAKEIAAALAREFGVPRRAAYARVVAQLDAAR